MPETVQQVKVVSSSLGLGWGKTVENSRIMDAQAAYLITSSTAGLLEISQNTMLVRLFSAVCPQVGRIFAHGKSGFSYLMGGTFYSLSTYPMNTNEF